MNVIDLIRYTAGILRARADYYTHPTRSCANPECDQLRDTGMLCPGHERANEKAAARRRAVAS